MPRSFAFLDDKLKKLVNGTIPRGKTELALTVVHIGAPEASISVNLDLAKGYLDAIGEMSSALGVYPGPLYFRSLILLFHLSGYFPGLQNNYPTIT